MRGEYAIDPLLRAILEDPADDAARLVYADYLEENNHSARAAFVRSQILTPGGAEEYPLLRANYAAWSPLPGCVEKHSPYASSKDWAWVLGQEPGVATFWRRGFVDAVICTLAAWLEHGPRAVREHPVTRVVATDKTATIQGPLTRVHWVEGGGDGTEVPPAVFALLGGSPRDLHTTLDGALISLERTRTYRTPDEATADLNRASLEWALSEAGVNRVATGVS